MTALVSGYGPSGDLPSVATMLARCVPPRRRRIVTPLRPGLRTTACAWPTAGISSSRGHRAIVETIRYRPIAMLRCPATGSSRSATLLQNPARVVNHESCSSGPALPRRLRCAWGADWNSAVTALRRPVIRRLCHLTTASLCEDLQPSRYLSDQMRARFLATKAPGDSETERPLLPGTCLRQGRGPCPRSSQGIQVSADLAHRRGHGCV